MNQSWDDRTHNEKTTSASKVRLDRSLSINIFCIVVNCMIVICIEEKETKEKGKKVKCIHIFLHIQKKCCKINIIKVNFSIVTFIKIN